MVILVTSSPEFSVCRQNVDGQNVDRHNLEQTKCRTYEMSNRQNVEQTKTDWIFPWTTYFFLKSCQINFKIFEIWSSLGFFPTMDMNTPLSFDPVFIGDAQCAETNEKLISEFSFSSYREKFIENWGKNDYE